MYCFVIKTKSHITRGWYMAKLQRSHRHSETGAFLCPQTPRITSWIEGLKVPVFYRGAASEQTRRGASKAKPNCLVISLFPFEELYMYHGGQFGSTPNVTVALRPKAE